jgi:pimeloyl-ACP methyl ester carboxylesterase
MMIHGKHRSGLTGLFEGQKWESDQGLYMLHPYQADKVPVVFVHGLMSQPEVWLAMVNDLRGDSVLREHYQFWAFLYPTGNPILYSAHLLRQDLLDARETVDPEHDDPAFNQMVLVGHSMGGILSRLMITSSGSAFYDAVTGTPLEDLGLPAEDTQLLRDVFFFEPLPFIRRAVFIATPHRGSDLADLGLIEIFIRSIVLPGRVHSLTSRFIQALAGTGQARRLIERIPTSIDGLSPGSALSEAIDQTVISPTVPYHSIIANHKAADTPGDSDKVVPYESSHVDGAESELIVKDTHGCTDNPLVIREVRRILLKHLEESGLRRAPSVHKVTLRR